MKLKYLLTLYCEEDGFWDTSGYCHWSKKAFHDLQEFDLDDEEELTKAIAVFIEEYPKGDYEIYVIQSYREWNEDEHEWEEDEIHENKICNIQKEALELSKKIREDKKQKEKEAAIEISKKNKERIKQEELKKLAELKAKWE